MEFDPINEYGDFDAISCANGDYNAWEENQVFLDNEGYEPEDRYLDSMWEDNNEYYEHDWSD